jgi:hypothetical protein
MEKFTRGMMGLLLLGGLITGCTPAHYTQLRKVKHEEGNTRLAVHRENQEAVPELPSARLEPVKVVEIEAEYIANAESPDWYASTGDEPALPTKRKIRRASSARNAVMEAKSPLTHRAALTETGKDVKVSEKSRTEAADEYKSEVRTGLLWSLIAAVIMVWLVGVLFTGSGGLVHVLLGVALILVVLNLLV